MQHNSSFVFYSTVMISVKFSSGRLQQHFAGTWPQKHKKKKKNKSNSLFFFFANFSAALLNGDVRLFSIVPFRRWLLSLAYTPYSSYKSKNSPCPNSANAFASRRCANRRRRRLMAAIVSAPLRLCLKFSAVVIFRHSRMWSCRCSIYHLSLCQSCARSFKISICFKWKIVAWPPPETWRDSSEHGQHNLILIYFFYYARLKCNKNRMHKLFYTFCLKAAVDFYVCVSVCVCCVCALFKQNKCV